MKPSYRFSLRVDRVRNSHTESRGLVRTRKSLSSEPKPSSRASCLDGALFPAQSPPHLFDEIPNMDVVSATALIGQVARHNLHEEAMKIFSTMLCSGIRPNEFTFGTVFRSATALRNVSLTTHYHACAIKMGLESNVFVGSSILDSYVKISTINEAQRTFDDTYGPNVVSWTSLVRGYLKRNKFEDAMSLFRKMPERNVVSWNAMISGCSQTGRNEETVNLFVEMLREGFVPDESTFCCVISAVANIAALGIGKSFHASAIKFLGHLGVFVANSLISCYAKCGSMEDSLLVFDRLRERNIVSWNAVICGCAQNGKGSETLRLFTEMKGSGFKPNSVTVLGLLWTCNHAGLVDEGYSYFNEARSEDSGMLKPEHYACVVDTLARSGHFREAKDLIQKLPFNPGIGFWKALLGGCQIHSNTELGEFAAQKIRELDPADVSSYVMLSNAHSSFGKWQSVSTIRREIKEKGLKIVPGCSWIEVRSKVRVFVNGDTNHDRKDEIVEVLKLCIEHLRDVNNP